MRTLLLILSLLALCFVSSAVAQQANAVGSVSLPLKSSISDAGVLFLLIQPSLRANGMGGASVTSNADDAIAVAFNPAHLSRLARENRFAVEFYPTKTDWLPAFGGLKYDANTVYFGYNFKDFDKKIPVSFGLAYTRVFLDLGEQVITDSLGNDLGTFHSSERANVWTVGFGVDYLIKAGIGWSFKNIESNLLSFNTPGQRSDGSAEAKARDFGVVAYLPISDVFSKLTDTSLEIHPGVRPFLGSGFGYSKSNIGDNITYPFAERPDALPRIARVGLSVDAGMTYVADDLTWRLFAFEILNEAEQSLVRRNADFSYSYAGGIGDIDFWDDVARGKRNRAEIIKKKGWELNLFEIFSIRGGHYEDPFGQVDYKSRGTGTSLLGIFKTIRAFSSQLQKDPMLNFLTSHLDVQFNTSSLDIEREHPLAGTSFSGIRISIY